MLSVALPLFLITLTGQYMPGMLVLRNDGFRTSANPIVTVTGLGSLLMAPFGSHAFNIAAITFPARAPRPLPAGLQRRELSPQSGRRAAAHRQRLPAGRLRSGQRAPAALSAAYITANKNSVPNDPRSPFVTSGLRIGTPAVTTRGFGVPECEQLAGWLCDVLDGLESGGSEQVAQRVREQVVALCRRHPVYR